MEPWSLLPPPLHLVTGIGFSVQGLESDPDTPRTLAERLGNVDSHFSNVLTHTPYRDTSLIRNHPPLGPYSGLIPMTL